MQENVLVLGKYTLKYLGANENHDSNLFSDGSEKIYTHIKIFNRENDKPNVARYEQVVDQVKSIQIFLVLFLQLFCNFEIMSK